MSVCLLVALGVLSVGIEVSGTKPHPTCKDRECGDQEYCVMMKVACKCAPPPAVCDCPSALPVCEAYEHPRITCSNVRCAGGPCVMEKICNDKDGSCETQPVCKKPKP